MADCLTATSVSPTCLVAEEVVPICLTTVEVIAAPELGVFSADGLTEYTSLIDFGDVHIDETEDIQIRLQNVGQGTLILYTVIPPTNWSIVAGPTSYSLAPDEYTLVTLRFTPPG
jgi:hypothetical protein